MVKPTEGVINSGLPDLPEWAKEYVRSLDPGAQEEMLMYAPKEVQGVAFAGRAAGPGSAPDVRTEAHRTQDREGRHPRGDEKEGGEVREGLTIVMREMTNQRSSRPCIVREARGDASEAATRRRAASPFSFQTAS